MHVLPSIGANPWLISGDFNSPISGDDRINGAPISANEIKDFDDFIVVLGCALLRVWVITSPKVLVWARLLVGLAGAWGILTVCICTVV